MGRQPYIIRLALGRSPYELPDSSSTQATITTQSHDDDSAHTDEDYVQQYDERGHPVFPKSKALARDLRRAKNDVLSTMGVVVSGETGRSGTTRDKKKVKDITAENDYGLVIETVDHVMYFFGSWWVGSFGSRIQTFKRYTHNSFWNLIQSEIREVGWTGLLFAGIPAWAIRVILPICRTHVVEPLILYFQNKIISRYGARCTSLVQNTSLALRSMIRMFLPILFEQVHMFCVLQTIQIIPHTSFPKIFFSLPFTQSSLVRLPSLPATFSTTTLGQFASGLITAPFTLAFTYTLLRPFIEDRIYRIIRRQLPKQEQPDEFSLQVAMENDLLAWTIPVVAQQVEDGTRSNLSVLEIFKEEFHDLQKQLINWLDWGWSWGRENSLNSKMSNPSIPDLPEPTQTSTQSVQQEAEHTPTGDEVESSFDTSLILANEQLTHSPAQITPRSLDGLRPLGQAGVDSINDSNATETSWLPFQDNDLGSRPDTLLSRPASPESPPTSPRIRASLTHQNSFTTTMELSLQTSRNTQRNQQIDTEVVSHNTNGILDDWSLQIDNSMSQPTPLDLTLDHPDLMLPDSLENDIARHAIAVPPDVSEIAQQLALNPEGVHELLWGVSDENTVVPAADQLTVLPDTIEEPLHSPTYQDNMDLLSEVGTQELAQVDPDSLPLVRSRSQHETGPLKQRVTVLSSVPTNALAHHLASLITGVLFIPFRSFLYRTLATSYLTSPTAEIYGVNNAVSLSDIRGINAFAGGGSRQDMVAYMGKLAVVCCLQVAVSGGILNICSATAIGIGKRLFRWGQL
ncbi:hypothetical protein BGW36DRAFT_323720 [Talaromyces proteolyticus]|uniref:Uncharacterized protein n=1 Tax=Talaromyces proteolyticus TaxID=1131652 RepID=A0AAD4PTL0_9EURO|nr:uncharacterized protein BGW36DRAFT_323720 [Talaromyces proteolyticus]KAH8693623.1 hypothetical protein BGW36DRAFT_323720 [Talaromyces proteolyticus]